MKNIVMNKIISSVVLTLLSALLGISVTHAENIDEIYKLAVNNDPLYRGAKQEYLGQQQIKEQQFALFLPAVNLTANYTEIDQTNTASGTDTSYEYNTKNYTLNLKQMLYRHDYFIQYKQADLQLMQAAANFNSAAQNLIIRVAENYFQILAAIDNLDLANAEKKAIKEQLNQTTQRFNVGLTAITDVHEARSRYDLSVAQTIVAENQLAISKENLRELITQSPNHLARLSPQSPLLTPNPQNIDQWVKIASEQSLSLIASEKAMLIAREEIYRNRAGHYPTLDLIASHGYSETDGGALVSLTGREQEETRIGMQLTVPIFQGGLINARTTEAAHGYSQAKEQHEQQRRITERLTRTAYLNVIANISQVKAYQQALKSSKTALEATDAGYEVGTRTAVDVLNSHREVFRAQRDYAQSRYNYILETLRLKQAAGTLSENDLHTINNWLQ